MTLYSYLTIISMNKIYVVRYIDKLLWRVLKLDVAIVNVSRYSRVPQSSTEGNYYNDNDHGSYVVQRVKSEILRQKVSTTERCVVYNFKERQMFLWHHVIFLLTVIIRSIPAQLFQSCYLLRARFYTELVEISSPGDMLISPIFFSKSWSSHDTPGAVQTLNVVNQNNINMGNMITVCSLSYIKIGLISTYTYTVLPMV